jgi:L-amino acid N-acyltransferase YncA
LSRISSRHPAAAKPTIRIARREDLGAIVAIYNSTIPSRQVTADLDPVTVESRLSWFEAHPPEHRPLWVIERKTDPKDQDPAEVSIAGWLSFQDFYGRPAYNATGEASLYVHADDRRQGYGSLLLRHGLAEAESLGIKTLLGFIFGHNAPSLALFQRFGFQNWGRLPRIAQLDEQERDLIILGLRLN